MTANPCYIASGRTAQKTTHLLQESCDGHWATAYQRACLQSCASAMTVCTAHRWNGKWQTETTYQETPQLQHHFVDTSPLRTTPELDTGHCDGIPTPSGQLESGASQLCSPQNRAVLGRYLKSVHCSPAFI
jgi:hypothetical protein